MFFFYFQDWLYWYLIWSPGESIGVTVRSGFSSSEMNKTWTKAVMSRFTLFRPGGKCWLLHWQNLWLSRWIQNYSFPLRTENVQFEDFTIDNKFGIIYLFIYCFFKKKKIKCRFSCSLICLCLDVILSDPLVFMDILGKGALWFLELENLWTVVCFRMMALLKRFRLHFSDVIVMTDSEKRPQAKKYVGKKLQLPPRGTPMWTCFSS